MCVSVRGALGVCVCVCEWRVPRCGLDLGLAWVLLVSVRSWLQFLLPQGRLLELWLGCLGTLTVYPQFFESFVLDLGHLLACAYARASGVL